MIATVTNTPISLREALLAAWSDISKIESDRGNRDIIKLYIENSDWAETLYIEGGQVTPTASTSIAVWPNGETFSTDINALEDIVLLSTAPAHNILVFLNN